MIIKKKIFCSGKPRQKSDGLMEDCKEGISDDRRMLNRSDKRDEKGGMGEKSKSRDDTRDDRGGGGGGGGSGGHGSHRSIHSHSPFRRRHSPRKEVLSFSQIKVYKL